MKTVLKLLLIIFGSVNIYAQTYVVKGAVVYYYDKIIKDADANSFDVLYQNQYFSKDKNTIYYKGNKTTYDAKTFEIHHVGKFELDYFSDKNDVYVSRDDVIIAIGSESPKVFNFITEDIAIDNEIIYWRFKQIPNSDASSFQIISQDIFKDKNHVYNEGYTLPINPTEMKIYKKSKGYDSYSIEFIGDQDIVCNDFYNNCYQLDMTSFNYINYNFVKDNSHVLYRNNYLKANVATFEVPIADMEHYAKDKFHQFYLDETFPVKVDQKYIKPDSLKAFKIKLEKQLENAFNTIEIQKKYDKDAKASLTTIYTFPNSNNTIIEKGKNIYMNGIRQRFIDAESFEIFTNDYAKDKNQVYLIYEYDDKVTFNPINEIDPATFSIIDNNYDAYCKDANSVYCIFDKIIDADPNTFKIINKYHTEDKNTIFVEGSKLYSIQPTKNIQLKNIDNNYFSFGDKIIYINDGFEVFVGNQDLSNFKVFNSNYATSGKQLIYKGKTIGTLEVGETIIESDSEKLITSKHRVFEYGQNMSSSKEKKLYKYFNSNYSTDGHRLYYKDVFEIKGVDLADIHHSGYYIQYFTFKNNKALYKNIVFDIDLNTFERLEGLHYARDKNFVYYDGKKTKLDPSTFFILGEDYTSDKKGVYYNNKLISEADSNSFYVFGKYGFDHTYFYHYGKRILRSKVNLKQ